MAYPKANRTFPLIQDASTGTDKIEGEMGAIPAQCVQNINF
jgi:hypothetical protein